MASIDRTGLTAGRVFLGVFFIFKPAQIPMVRRHLDSGRSVQQLAKGLRGIDGCYLERVATPGLPLFARLVPLGELVRNGARGFDSLTPLAFTAFSWC
jgi:hypothetical protein